MRINDERKAVVLTNTILEWAYALPEGTPGVQEMRDKIYEVRGLIDLPHWRQREYVTLKTAGAVLDRSELFIRRLILQEVLDPVYVTPGAPVCVTVASLIALVDEIRQDANLHKSEIRKKEGNRP